jgi:enoyl-CoA hydratase
VSIALSADLVLASSKAFFMLAFTKIGLMPDGGATALVAASAGRAKAMRMALLAERLSAEEAESLGLVSHVFDAESFEKDAEDVIAELRTGPMVGYARTKHAINVATLASLDPAFALEREGQLGLLAAADFAEGVAAFNEKRPPKFTDTV